MNRRRRKKLSARLVRAAMQGDPATATRLLRAGADPNHPGPDGTTPLYAASVQDEPAVVRALLAAGAHPDAESAAPGAEGTPLCAAACWGHTGVVRELLAHGADPGLREDAGTGRTPLEWALAGPYPETAELLRAPSVPPLNPDRQ
ncbi:ankyrin repeat domain-containing protein [Streptomyces sp. NPDC004610]|uniref:ankyrin repeat domain-containing protein n=1 Tax=unclassified Streptomyces TaxID=2593676 RepID=UPI0033A105D5